MIGIIVAAGAVSGNFRVFGDAGALKFPLGAAVDCKHWASMFASSDDVVCLACKSEALVGVKLLDSRSIGSSSEVKESVKFLLFRRECSMLAFAAG